MCREPIWKRFLTPFLIRFLTPFLILFSSDDSPPEVLKYLTRAKLDVSLKALVELSPLFHSFLLWICELPIRSVSCDETNVADTFGRLLAARHE